MFPSHLRIRRKCDLHPKLATWAQVEYELEARGLSKNGSNRTLLKRIEDHDAGCCEARLRIWNDRYAAWLPKSPSNRDESFPQFSKLSVELQIMIWELSLPGSAVIEWHQDGKSETELLFDRSGGNPAALFVNKVSRGVALKRYQFCMDAPDMRQIYANLTGPNCDVFCIVPEFSSFYDNSIIRADRDEIPIHSVWNDLFQAERIAVHRWYCPNQTLLRRRLSLFTNLREVLLVAGGTDQILCGRKGTVVLEDISDLEKKEAAGKAVEWWGLKDSWKGFIPDDANEFITANLSDEEKTNGIPKAKVVLANRILSAPWDGEDAPGSDPSSVWFDW